MDQFCRQSGLNSFVALIKMDMTFNCTFFISDPNDPAQRGKLEMVLGHPHFVAQVRDHETL